MKTERGVMVMKNGKAWGKVYEDGHSTAYGWMDAEDAPIHDPEFCRRPTDVTYRSSHQLAEIATGELVMVERVTTVTVLPPPQTIVIMAKEWHCTTCRWSVGYSKQATQQEAEASHRRAGSRMLRTCYGEVKPNE